MIWTPNPGPQSALIATPVDEVLFGGARGGGKTAGTVGKWIHHWQHEAGRFARGVIFRRTYPELEDIIEQLAIYLPAYGAQYHEGKKTWRMPDGALLKLRFLAKDKDSGRYQGHSYTFIAFDEAGNFPSPAPILKLRATLRSTARVRRFMMLTANPGGVGHQWLKERYIDPAPPWVPYRDPETGRYRVFIPSRVTDNPRLNDAAGYMADLRGSGPPWLVAAWLNGDWNASPDGGIIKGEWLRYYDRLPSPADTIRIIQSWDTAQKTREIHDYSVCTTWIQAYTPVGIADFLADVWRGRLTFPDLKAKVIEKAREWNPHVVLIEDKGNGTSLIQDTQGIPIQAVEPVKEKAIRMCAESPRFASGMVLLPKWAPWKTDYEIELVGFPAVEHDDQVDSTSQALKYLRESAYQFEIVTGISPRESTRAYQ